MNIKQIVKALKESNLENVDELVTGIEDLYHTLNDENKTLRTARNDTVDKVKKFSGVDTDDLEAMLTALQEKGDGDKSLAKKYEKLEGRFTTLENEKLALEKANREKDRNSAITKQLNKAGVRKEAVDGLSQMFGSMSKLDDDGEWMIGDNDLNTGISDYVNANTYFLASGQKAGSGATEPKNSGNKKDYLSNADVKDMSSEERKANMDLIKSSIAKASADGITW